MKPERFTIAIPQPALDDLRVRLERFRAAPDFGNEDWRYGMEGCALRSLVDSWLDEYDWRAAEAEMNRYEHWRVSIDGVPIHYMIKRGVPSGAAAVSKPMPLIVTHGWPWTFWDHRYVVDALADPGGHGGDPADAFDVIVPSLPGYVFSSPLTTTGIGWARTADLWASRGRLRDGTAGPQVRIARPRRLRELSGDSRARLLVCEGGGLRGGREGTLRPAGRGGAHGCEPYGGPLDGSADPRDCAQ